MQNFMYGMNQFAVPEYHQQPYQVPLFYPGQPSFNMQQLQQNLSPPVNLEQNNSFQSSSPTYGLGEMTNNLMQMDLGSMQSRQLGPPLQYQQPFYFPPQLPSFYQPMPPTMPVQMAPLLSRGTQHPGKPVVDNLEDFPPLPTAAQQVNGRARGTGNEWVPPARN